jgi:epoxyqueuosine reductase
MKEINIINFLEDNDIKLSSNFKLGVTSLPSNINFEKKISEIKDKQLHANMKFTFSKPEYSGLADKFSWAKSALLLTYNYKNKTQPSMLVSPGYGQIARFAEEDYYLPLKNKILEIEKVFENLDVKFQSFIDNPSHYDRTFFVSSGLGWQGKSTMMLTPGSGPWQLLATIYVDFNFKENKNSEFSCGECNLCQISCPTGALDMDYKLDSNKCISYWLQSPEIIPYEIRDAIGNKFYGCDDCLTSCPPGQENKIIVTFNKNQRVNLQEIIESDDEHLLEKYYWFYIPKRNAEFLKRNAIIALGNNPDNSTSEFFRNVYSKFSTHLKIYTLWALVKNNNVELCEQLIILYDSGNPNILEEYEKLKEMISLVK